MQSANIYAAMPEWPKGAASSSAWAERPASGVRLPLAALNGKHHMTPDEFEDTYRAKEVDEDRKRFLLSGVIAVLVIVLVLLAVAYPDLALQVIEGLLDD